MYRAHTKTLRECIRNFTPAWYTVIMGTGSVSALVARFHFGAGSLTLEILSLVVFFLNLLFFILISVMTVARYWMFPEMWRKMLSHPAQSLFIGAFPMGVTTLINSALTVYQRWSFGGSGYLYTLWGLWWADLWISFMTAFGMLYIMMTSHSHSLAKMASVWVLPMVTLIVASSTGGLLAESLLDVSQHAAAISTGVSLASLIMGLSLALMVITVYLTRLILHGPPDSGLILSAFIVLGPLGQGGFSLLINGSNVVKLLQFHLEESLIPRAIAGQMIYAACFSGAWILWSMGIAWIAISLISVYAAIKRERIPFALAYWGTIFPNGVFALLSVQLGEVLNSPFFHYFGAIWSCLVFLLWIYVLLKTIPVVWDTTIFVAPCLATSPVSIAVKLDDPLSATVQETLANDA